MLLLLRLALGVMQGLTGLVLLADALKESDSTEKLQHTSLDVVFWGFRLGHEFGRNIIEEHPGFGLPDAKIGRVHQSGGDYAPVMDREGIG